MFARYRRGGATTTTSPQRSSLPPQTGGPSGRRTRRSGSDYDVGDDNDRGCGEEEEEEAAQAAASLAELRDALDRLEFLTSKIADENEEEEEEDEEEEDEEEEEGTTAGGSPSSSAAAADEKISDAGADSTAAGEDDEKDGAAVYSASDKINNNNNNNINNNNDKPTKYERSPSATAAQIKKDAEADFLSVEPDDESEAIELIRRIAELVALSERRAGQLSMDAAFAAADDDDARGMRDEKTGESSGKNSSSDGGDGDGGGDNHSQQSKGENTGENGGGGGSGGASPQKEEKDRRRRRRADEYDYNGEDAALPHLAVFELFCERNALANIVNVVTGAAFAAQSSNDDDDNNPNKKPRRRRRRRGQQQRRHTRLLLPPIAMATQAVQSISILVQNASRATSLYFLLSNNRVNDLIGLPLHLYKRAELNAIRARYDERRHNNHPSKSSRRRRGGEQRSSMPLPPMPSEWNNYQSPEMGELTTHFVSFLKSLAMRVNAETLQFFLSFPLNERRRKEGGLRRENVDEPPAADGSFAGKETSETRAKLMGALTGNMGDGEVGATDEDKLFDEPPSETKAKQLMGALTGTDDNEEEKSTEDKLFDESPMPPKVARPQSIPSRPTNDSPKNPQPQLTYLERRNVVEFPLYARALEFCTTEQDSFVRVTAMNVCMNILRLATVCSDDDDDDDDVDDDEKEDEEHGLERSTEKEDDQNNNSDEDKSRKAARRPTRQRSSAPLPTATPSGMLHEAPPLPLQDRIAIARFACDPRRVSDLVSPLCARLTGQFGQVEGTVRALEELNGKYDGGATTAAADDCSATATATTSGTSGAATGNASARGGKRGLTGRKTSSLSSNERRVPKNASANGVAERNRLRDSVRNLIANVQDELLLLDDLLRVGLISLNEQAIEMMLATFVYPMLLQPLLLPLHRYGSSSKRGGASASPRKNKGATTKQRPVIVLQSPPPFSSRLTKKEEEKNILAMSESVAANATSADGAGDGDGDGTEAGPQSTGTASSDNDGDGNDRQQQPQQQLHSSGDMDLAPSKTALFGLSVVFHTLSNPTFRHLLLTALLHPLSPEASGGAVICAPPRITLPMERKGKKKTAWSCDDFQLEIRMEGNQRRRSEGAEAEAEAFRRDVNVYAFGTESSAAGEGPEGEKEEEGAPPMDFANACVFILAPALVDMLRHNNDGSTRPEVVHDASNNDATKESETTASLSRRRKNPYRSVLLSSVSGAREMVALQPLATAALHAAVSSVSGSVLRKILFAPSNAKDDNNGSTAATMDETLRCLCRAVVSVRVTYDGWWKAEFNAVAARTLADVASDDVRCLRTAGRMIGDVRSQASEFLMTLPSSLDRKSKEQEMGRRNSNDSAKQRGIVDSIPARRNNDLEGGGGGQDHLQAWLLDRFFFDPADRDAVCVVENVCYLKERSEDKENAERKDQYRYGLEVLSTTDIGGTSALLCEGTAVVDNNMVVGAETRGNTPFHCAASWALACLYLDAFCMKLSKSCVAFDEGMVENGPKSTSVASVTVPRSCVPKLSYISSTESDSCDDYDDDWNDEAADSLAHISSKFAIALLDEGESSSSSSTGDAVAPAHGSAVGLVGRAAFPCVCEVSARFGPLFSGRTCISNEGIRWQSLYLVVAGRWAVLAEPGHGGSGGEGRVITACRLACLAVKKDSSSLVNNKTPARRLLLAHGSLDPRPPSLFTVDSSASSSRGHSGSGGGGPNLGPAGLRLTRSRMDLWFEDSNAAGHACRILSGKIAKARAKRGERIRSALLAT